MKEVPINDEDIRKIRITCRCGTESTAEVPEQFARLMNIYLCPDCKALFGIQKQNDNWKIERMS